MTWTKCDPDDLDDPTWLQRCCMAVLNGVYYGFSNE